MIKRVGNRYHSDNHIEIHFVVDNHDLSICGCDVVGDEDYSGIGDVEKPVNCPDCLKLVLECRTVKLLPAERPATPKKRKKNKK